MASKDSTTTPVQLSRKLGAKAGTAVTVLFTTSRDGLWVAWPKKASSIETDLTFEAVQEIGLANGLVDNKSCAVDEDWQALRFVYRRADRPR